MIFLVLASFTSARAEYSGSRYIPVRARGLGNAYLPLATDGPSALYYQPAGISKIKRPHFELLNIQLEPNLDYSSNITLTKPASANIYSLPSYRQYMQESLGSAPGFNGTLIPTISFKGFSVGMLTRASIIGFENQDELNYTTLYQLIPAAGFGISLAQGIVRFGIAVQYVHQAKGTNSYTIEEANNADLGFNEGLKEGSGLSFNLGYALNPPTMFLPQLNVVARNIGGLNHASKAILPVSVNSIGTLETEPMTIDSSISVEPKIGGGAKSNVILQWNDMTNRSTTSIAQRLALGLEIDFSEFFMIRLGLGEGYPNFGFGIHRDTVEVDFAYFNLERGLGFRHTRDGRVGIQIKFRVF